MTQITHVTPSELQVRLTAGEGLVLLDIREDFERAINRIPTDSTDLHIPMGEIPSRLAELAELANTSPLVIYCHHGVRSMTVARWLAARGIPNIVNLDGGIDAYSSVDLSVTRY